MITQSWIESFIAEYDATDLTDEIENTKILENYLYFACCLYAFHVYGHDLIFNIFTKFVESYKVKDVELIILLLRCIGFNLRKDDPTKLKSLIVDIQKKSTQDNFPFIFRIPGRDRTLPPCQLQAPGLRLRSCQCPRHPQRWRRPDMSCDDM